jgi:hypothetical protein
MPEFEEEFLSRLLLSFLFELDLKAIEVSVEVSD